MLCVSRTPTVLLRQCVSKGLNLKTTTVDQQLLPQHSWCHPPLQQVFKSCRHCSASLSSLIETPEVPHRETHACCTMKTLNNRAQSHLTGQVDSELDKVGNGGWVNQGYCSSPPPFPQVTTVFNPKTHFEGNMNSLYNLDTPVTLPEDPPTKDQSLKKKRRGCCSFIKGKNTFESTSRWHFFFEERLGCMSSVTSMSKTSRARYTSAWQTSKEKQKKNPKKLVSRNYILMI